ncbi:hypothetical protein ABDK56_13065 [Sphingomonas sp. ASV193]|uniref:hypothetical protein n=1 Tax=Sphingomonas sp. ASV193 TaxID=3144405 RepID=UPI0032E89430
MSDKEVANKKPWSAPRVRRMALEDARDAVAKAAELVELDPRLADILDDMHHALELIEAEISGQRREEPDSLKVVIPH